ncbi:MAG TPA: hypothetical protein VEK57_20920 [Thermoanaerobaculia bacterium]|nr:hypothetical protein [Thermoanaerobaculia bacterium]
MRATVKSLLLSFLALVSTPLFGLTVGPEIPLTQRRIEPAPFLRNTPRVASNGAGFLVVWNDVRGLASEVRGTRVGPTGEVLDASLVIGSRGSGAVVASDGSDYAVAYNCTSQMLGGVCLARIDAESGAVFSAGRIERAMNPAIASNGSGYVIVYQTSRSETALVTDTVRGIAVRPDGSLGAPFTIADALYAPSIASNGASNGTGYYVITSTFTHLSGVAVSEEGVAGPHQQLAGPAGFGPAVFGWSIASNGDGYLVAFQKNTGVVEQAYTTALQAVSINAGGTAGATHTLLSTGHAWHPEATWTGSQYLISYTHSDARAIAPYLLPDADGDVRAIPYNAFGAASAVYPVAENEGREASSSGASNDGSATLIVWEHVHRPGAAQIEGRLMGRGEIPGSLRPFVVSQSITWQESVTAARIGESAMAAWSENSGERQKRVVKTTRLSAIPDASPRAGLAAPTSSRDQVRPALGGSALAWVEEDLGAPAAGSVKLSFFDTSSLGGPLDLGASAPGSRVSVAAAGNTHFVVWESPERQIVGIRLTPNGVIDVEPLVLSKEGVALAPVVVSNGENFFIAWNVEVFGEGCGVCLPLHELHAAVVSASGAIARPDFEIESADVSMPRLVSDGSDYTVLWAGHDTEGIHYRAAQTFTANGQLAGQRVALPVAGIPMAVTKVEAGYLVAVANGSQLEVARFDEDFQLVERVPVIGASLTGADAGFARGVPGAYFLAYQNRGLSDGASSRAVSREISERPAPTRRRSAGGR